MMTMTTMEEKKEDEYEEEESFLLFIAREVEESEETAHTNTLVTASKHDTKKKIQKTKKSNIWYAPHPQQQHTPPGPLRSSQKEVEKRKRENEDKNV